MPINVVLQNIDGSSRLKSSVDGEGGWNKCLPVGDSTFPLLLYVDPYGNAFFNPLQMPELLDELEFLISQCSDEKSITLLEKLRELAQECGASAHVYLRFVGD